MLPRSFPCIQAARLGAALAAAALRAWAPILKRFSRQLYSATAWKFDKVVGGAATSLGTNDSVAS